jgi:DNA polymerase III subunit delta'
MAHALLLCGPPGVGKRIFAEAMAARLLCERPTAEGMACGQCPSCHWRCAGNHPDLHRLEPENEAGAEDGSTTEGEEGAPEGEAHKKGSDQIVIAQLRALQARLLLTAHQAQGRVTLIEPAESMNPVTANALLKLLEEPPDASFFILISHRPGRLLPTLRSRCQTWVFTPPEHPQALAWLAQAHPDCPKALLSLAGGRPLEAARLARQGALADYERFVRDMLTLQTGRTSQPITVAGQWEQWLKSNAALASGMDRTRLLRWLQAWMLDLVLLANQAPPRFFTEHATALAPLALSASRTGQLSCYRYLTQQRALASHPLNLRLFLEDILIQYCAHLAQPLR